MAKKKPKTKSAVGGALKGGKKISDPMSVEYTDKPDPTMYKRIKKPKR